MRPIHVTGLAAWAPGFGSLDAFVRGERDASVTDPECAWVPARLLRGSSRLTRMFGEAAAQATSAAGRDPKTIGTVYTSSYGEIETMVLLLDVIFRGDGQLSPMRFKNSVHNAASGLGSIGQGNTSFSTALAAGDRSFEAGVIEAIALVNERGGDVVISCADDVIPPPLACMDSREALAVGIVLSAEPGPAPHARIAALTQLEAPVPLPGELFGRPVSLDLALNPAAQALPLLAALLAGRKGVVPLAFGADNPFAIELV
jgi:hypothetical protein